MAGLIALIVGGLLIAIRHTSRNKAARIENINKEYGYGKGLILMRKANHGHFLDVKYQIAGKEYIYSGGWDKNPNNLEKGDSIKFRYALDAPELIITELDNEY